MHFNSRRNFQKSILLKKHFDDAINQHYKNF